MNSKEFDFVRFQDWLAEHCISCIFLNPSLILLFLVFILKPSEFDFTRFTEGPILSLVIPALSRDPVLFLNHRASSQGLSPRLKNIL